MSSPPPTLGLRHLALTIPRDRFAATVAWYREALGMATDWEPDPDNVYLTSGSDNLALHVGEASTEGSPLDHLGFLMPDAQTVHRWYEHIDARAEADGVEMLTPVKTHRDGATSFYLLDPAGHKVQFVHVPSLSAT